MNMLEVDSAGREGSHHEPLHYVLLGEVYPGKTGVIADTLNVWQIEPEEQRKRLERLAHCHNVHDRLVKALGDLLACIDNVDANKLPEIPAAEICIARQALALSSQERGK